MSNYMFKIALAALLTVLTVRGAAAQTVGQCAWAEAPAAIRENFLAAYKNNMNQASEVLQDSDVELTASFEHCVGRKDIPKLWQQGTVGSNAIQSAAAAELLVAKKFNRGSLDEAWIEAPIATRDCTRANAQKIFGVSQFTCSDSAAPLWFLQHFSISPQAERPVAGQILIYYNAKAQDEWAEALISKFRAQPQSAK